MIYTDNEYFIIHNGNTEDLLFLEHYIKEIKGTGNIEYNFRTGEISIGKTSEEIEYRVKLIKRRKSLDKILY